jgi:hypothetical protein
MKQQATDPFLAIGDPNRREFHEILQWIDYFDQFWHTRLKKLEELLNKKTKK